MDLRLDGKVAVVTGASKGIGRAITGALAASGAQVMLSSRKADALAAAAADMDGDVATFAAHAGHPEEAEACIAATVERFGGIDILVNNAATNPYQGATLDIDLPRFDKTVEVNWRGPLVWVQAARRHGLGGRPGASVLNIASIGGLSVEPSIGIYNGTKAALLHLTRTLALEMAPDVHVDRAGSRVGEDRHGARPVGARRASRGDPRPDAPPRRPGRHRLGRGVPVL